MAVHDKDADADVGRTQAEIIEENRHEFLEHVQGVYDHAASQLRYPDKKPPKGVQVAELGAAEHELVKTRVGMAVRGMLGVLDGTDGGNGYFVIPKEDDLAMMPASQAVWDQANAEIEFREGLDIAGDGELVSTYVQSLFDAVEEESDDDETDAENDDDYDGDDEEGDPIEDDD